MLARVCGIDQRALWPNRRGICRMIARAATLHRKAGSVESRNGAIPGATTNFRTAAEKLYDFLAVQPGGRRPWTAGYVFTPI